jgi:large subunit ribosomal protein L23
MNPYNVLVKPVLSEKSSLVREAEGKVTFEVNLGASKDDITKAIKVVFGADVEAVNTMITRQRSKRRGMFLVKPKKVKKAVVTLKEGSKIRLFDDA